MSPPRDLRVPRQRAVPVHLDPPARVLARRLGQGAASGGAPPRPPPSGHDGMLWRPVRSPPRCGGVTPTTLVSLPRPSSALRSARVTGVAEVLSTAPSARPDHPGLARIDVLYCPPRAFGSRRSLPGISTRGAVATTTNVSQRFDVLRLFCSRHSNAPKIGAQLRASSMLFMPVSYSAYCRSKYMDGRRDDQGVCTVRYRAGRRHVPRRPAPSTSGTVPSRNGLSPAGAALADRRRDRPPRDAVPPIQHGLEEVVGVAVITVTRTGARSAWPRTAREPAPTITNGRRSLSSLVQHARQAAEAAVRSSSAGPGAVLNRASPIGDGCWRNSISMDGSPPIGDQLFRSRWPWARSNRPEPIRVASSAYRRGQMPSLRPICTIPCTTAAASSRRPR